MSSILTVTTVWNTGETGDIPNPFPNTAACEMQCHFINEGLFWKKAVLESGLFNKGWQFFKCGLYSLKHENIFIWESGDI